MDKSPDAFRTISEVADLLETPAHVLRFWESRFTQIRPVKRAGGRRYYRPADVALLTGIKHLLHDEGLTIRGVQKILREHGVRHVSGVSDEAVGDEDDAALEAALAASGGPQDGTAPLPPDEAETAQIIALQFALGQSRPSPDGVDGAALADRLQWPASADQTHAERPSRTSYGDDLFSRFASNPMPDAPPTLPPETEDLKIMRSFDGLGADSSSDTSTATPAKSVPPTEMPTEMPTEFPTGTPTEFPTEAPMQVWADEDVSAAPTAPLKITRIGAPQLASPMTDTGLAAQGPIVGMATRLRATRAADLSPSDRATLSILRAKARSLRDRLGSQPRSGA